MRRLLDALYLSAAWLAALFMVGVLLMVLLSIVSRLFHFYVPGTDAYAATHIRLYAEAIADPPPDDPARLAMATAQWLEDLLPSTAHRPWRHIAKEMVGLDAAMMPPGVSEIERRLTERIESLPSSMLPGLSEIECRLAQRIERLPSLRVMRAMRALYRRTVPLRIRQSVRRLRGVT